MATIKEGDKVRIHSASKELYDNKVGKVIHVWGLDKNPWGNIVVKIEGDNFQNCFLEEELELLKEITMEQNLKELLLKDLCARLPYGVMILEDIDKTFDGGCISRLAIITEIKGEKMFITKNSLTPLTAEEIRPYLRPMSSMTEEERRKLNRINNEGLDEWLNANNPIEKWSSTCRIDGESVDYMNSRHLDYRGLIPKGLALEAPEDMYKTI